MSFYLLVLVIVPALLLWNMKFLSKKGELVTKEDSVAIRGIAAIFVMAAHYTEWMQQTGAAGIHPWFYMVISRLGGMGVLMFFFISGYGTYESYGKFRPDFRYVTGRIRKIYIPYQIIKFILLLLGGLFYGTEHITWQRAVAVICVEDWFVQIILLEYLIFYIGRRWLPKHFFLVYQIAIHFALSMYFVQMGFPARYYNSMWLFVVGMICSLYKEKWYQGMGKAEHVKWYSGGYCASGNRDGIGNGNQQLDICSA